MAYPSVQATLPLVLQFDAAQDERSERSKRLTRHLLEHSPAPFARTTFQPGHVTASAVVVAPDRTHVLLVYHEKLERWLQPGGHCERTDLDVRAAAKREVLEETGISFQEAKSWPLVGIDVHDIPGTKTERGHRHHDLCFFVQATSCQLSAARAVAGVVLCPIVDLERYRVDVPLRTCLERALHVTL